MSPPCRRVRVLPVGVTLPPVPKTSPLLARYSADRCALTAATWEAVLTKSPVPADGRRHIDHDWLSFDVRSPEG
jgi:hypothetical protein